MDKMFVIITHSLYRGYSVMYDITQQESESKTWWGTNMKKALVETEEVLERVVAKLKYNQPIIIPYNEAVKRLRSE